MRYRFLVLTTLCLICFTRGFPDKVEDTLHEMSLEEKVGHLFMAFFYGQEIDDTARAFLNRTHLNNFIYYTWSNGLVSPAQVKKLSEQIYALHAHKPYLPLIATDQEGGIVARLSQEFTPFPGNMALAATNDLKLAKACGLAMGEEMRFVGMNVDFAPVVDVNVNPNNPIIGVRSFSDDPDTVISFAKAVIEGLHQANIFVTLKHFPGHGDTATDSHTGLPIVTKDFEALQNVELKPFHILLENADAIMTSHILFPSLDAASCATLSKKILTGMLKETWGYEGVVITDSLVMKGVAPNQETFEDAVASVQEASWKAFEAGADCLLLGRLEWGVMPTTPQQNMELIERTLATFVQRFKEHPQQQQRLDQSVSRILRLKERLSQTAFSSPDFAKHRLLSEEIAKKALTYLSPLTLFSKVDTTLQGRNIAIICPEPLKQTIETALVETGIAAKTLIYYSKESLDADDGEIERRAKEAIEQHDLTLFLSFNGHVMPKQLSLLQELGFHSPQGKLVIAGLRNPHDLLALKIENRHPVYLTYSPVCPSLCAFLKALDSKSLPPGHLPLQIAED